MRASGSVLDGQILGRLDRWRKARAVFVRPDGVEAERAVAAACGRSWARASVYGRARRLLVERTPELFLEELEKNLGPLAERVRVAPEDMRQTKWDAMSRLTPLPRARREVEALWLADELTMGEFFVEFQPIFDLASGDAIGYEGLLRGRGQGGVMRLAADIFPAAESLNLEGTFERFSWTCVLEAARAVPADALLFLNVNPRLIERSEHGLVALGEETERRGIPFSRLVLDLVEVETMPAAPELAQALTVPRDLGAVIALDDVTSGYGTLQFCHALQPEWIKVDSEVTRGIARDPRRRAILKFLADLSREFSFTLVAEGIEAAEDLDVCAAEGVGAAQGYFLARPAAEPPSASPEFRQWIAARPQGKRTA
ncbi:MAG TPA: EAL domain-containing protein [Thermoanaerobaculia bacterium]|nr:EAL domain-containing protein [Thermoanaerobaculia bacterium]